MTQALLPGAVVAAGTEQATTVTVPNEEPLADAGLDQRVPTGRTVLLDARGSRDPDGEIVEYAWEIRTPSGTTDAPACPDCPRTTFVPNETGRYEVRLTVVDDDGATSEDTLYVEVTSGSGPTVSLAGPSTIAAGSIAEFTAEAHAGSTELDRVEWRVDGTVVENTGLDGAAGNATLTGTFPDSGVHTVSVRVFDAANRSATDTMPLSVTDGGSTPPGNGSSPNGTPISPGPGGPGAGGGGSGAGSGGGSGAGNRSTLADDYDPVVDGPRVVTGSRPLSAAYRLGHAPPSDVVRSVTWIRESGRFASGDSATATWAPGDHRLFAIVEYTDGSSDAVTFPHDRTRVVADPEPALAIEDLDGNGSVSGHLTAGDDYGNLVDVTVSVDGHSVFERHARRAGSRPTLGPRVESDFRLADVEPNTTHEIVVRATDGRGQTATLRRSTTSSGGIEIVRAGFVNTPVDSYHERLDPSRYTAHHVIEVRLNGHDPESVHVDYLGYGEIMRLRKDVHRRDIFERDGSEVLVVNSYWASPVPDNYSIRYHIRTQGSENEMGHSEFDVTSSDPELVLTTRTDGTDSQAQSWGVVVDANRSFDPDHTSLDYTWTGAADSVDQEEGVGKFSSIGLGGVEVTDQNGESSSRNCCFLQFFAPRLEHPELLDDGPFNATDQVRFRIRSDQWAFSKSRNDYDIRLSYGSSSRYVDVINDTRVDVAIENSDDVETNQRRNVREAVIEVQAAALAEDTPQPTVYIYNEAHPDRIRNNVTLPTVEIRNQTTNERFRDNATVESVAYEVARENGTKQTTVDDRRELQLYLRDGYHIDRQIEQATGITLERRTEHEERHTTRVSFGSAEDRAQYIRAHPEFRTAGSRSHQSTQVSTKNVWRDDPVGPGESTGDTRMHTVPEQTRTLRQYRTETKRTREVTDTVRKPVQQTVERTVERTVTRCNRIVGCYEATVSETETETETVYRDVTVTREVTEWVTSTYWSRLPANPGDSATGQTKQVVVREEHQERQYEFVVEHEEQVTEETFFATRTRTETVEEWESYRTVSDRFVARRLAMQDGVRIGDVQQERAWIVEKQGDTTEVVSDYDDPSNVVETIAIVSGVVKEKRFNPITGETEIEVVDTFHEEIRRDGLVPVHYLLAAAGGTESDCRRGVHCEN